MIRSRIKSFEHIAHRRRTSNSALIPPADAHQAVTLSRRIPISLRLPPRLSFAQITDQQVLIALRSDQLLPLQPREHRLAWWVNGVSGSPFKSKLMAFLVRNNSLLTIFVNQVVLFS